jgi:ATP-binding cassette, subfamily B, bacterial PglK
LKEFKSIHKLYNTFGSVQARSAKILFILTTISVVIDAFGIASIMPLMAVVNNPEIIDNSQIAIQVFNYIELYNSSERIVFLGSLILLFIIFSISFKAYTRDRQYKFIYDIECWLSLKLYNKYVDSPYTEHLEDNRNLQKIVTSEVQHVVMQGILPMVLMASSGLSVLFIFLMLLIIEPIATLAMCGIFLVILYVIRRYTGAITKELGMQRFHYNEARFEWINHVTSNFKLIKLSGNESYFKEGIKGDAHGYAKAQSKGQTYSDLPRFLIEGVIFSSGIIAVLLGVWYELLGEIGSLLMLYALASYRLMPAFQQLYYFSTQLKFSNTSVDDLVEILNDNVNVVLVKNEIDKIDTINVKHVSYDYPGSGSRVLNDINLTLKKGRLNVLVGPTGSGKSTFADILMGLLKPAQGFVEVNGIKISKDTQISNKCIGYVPQEVNFISRNVYENIALGVSSDKVNRGRVELLCKAYNLHDKIVSNFEFGYETILGIEGAMLSGGQSQRLGLCRAMYKEPDFLILDEPTSAQDSLSSSMIWEELRKLSKDTLVVIISHEVGKIKSDDYVHYLEEGCLMGSGSLKNLLKSSDFAQKLIH